MPVPILTDFDRDVLLDLRIGRRMPRRPDAGLAEALQYLRAHRLILATVDGWLVTGAGRRASAEC